jgi:hypothetical protein
MARGGRLAWALCAVPGALAACTEDMEARADAGAIVDAGRPDAESPAMMCGHAGRLAPDLPAAWSHDLPVTAATFDGDGSLVVATMIDVDGQPCPGLVRFAPDGTELWTRRYDLSQPPPPPDVGEFATCPTEWYEVAIDPNGNILAVGYLNYRKGAQWNGSDILVRKLDRAGRLRWTYYNRNGNQTGMDVPTDVAAAADGDVLVSGRVESSWLIRLTPNGRRRWIWIGAPADLPAAVETDPAGNAIVAVEDQLDMSRIMRIDPQREETILAEIPAPIAVSAHWAGSLAVDAAGAPAVVVSDDHPHLLQLSPTGQMRWRADLEDLDLVDEAGCHIELTVPAEWLATAPDGSIVAVFGAEIDLELPIDDFPNYNPEAAVLIHFGGDGELLSAHLIPDGARENVSDLAVGPDGSIAVGLWPLTGPPRLIVVPPAGPFHRGEALP